MKVQSVAFFGYNAERDSRIARVLGTGKYKVLWHFPSGQATSAMASLRETCPDIFVINPAREDEIPGYRGLVSEVTIVVKKARPFGPDTILVD
jgi:hypothetical protein